MQGHLRAPLRLHVWGADAALAFFGGETEGGRCRERVEDAQEGALSLSPGPCHTCRAICVAMLAHLHVCASSPPRRALFALLRGLSRAIPRINPQKCARGLSGCTFLAARERRQSS